MLTELKYRTFDDLLDSVKIDMRTYDLEGMIDAQQLIKVASRVNYDLGLKINPHRSKLINVVNGKARLPYDFDVMNFAMLCTDRNILTYPMETKYSYKTYCQGVQDGVQLAEDVARANAEMIKIHTETRDIVPGDNIITHGLDTQDYIVQAMASTGDFIDLDAPPINGNQLNLKSNLLVTLTNVKITVIGGTNGQTITQYGDISTCSNGTVSARCSEVELTNSCSVSCKVDGFTYEYKKLIPIHFEKTKTLSSDPVKIKVNDTRYYTAVIKNGFVVTNFPDGELYINYKSLMEDDDGNLLVLDHPYTNEYYEYALKQRIYENLLLANEPVTAQLQLVEARLRPARNNALTYINTPDFRELRKNWEMNRKAQYSKYYDMFKRY